MGEADLVENRTFDEIEVGESASFERAITRRDIELFAAVSGDANPTISTRRSPRLPTWTVSSPMACRPPA